MNKPTISMRPLGLCRWSLSYAVRRWQALLLVLFAMILKTGLDVLQPWPMKLIVDQGTGRVLGCHIIGPDAAEMVQMAAIAMRMGATKADFDATMALHPSAAEELVTMRTKWTPPSH